jgi:hypothetical protein
MEITQAFSSKDTRACDSFFTGGESVGFPQGNSLELIGRLGFSSTRPFTQV